MDTSVTLANWRTSPYSSQSFHNVGKLVPAARIEAPEKPWMLDTRLTSLDALEVVDRFGRARPLLDVLTATDTRGLVVLHKGRLATEWYGGGYDGNSLRSYASHTHVPG